MRLGEVFGTSPSDSSAEAVSGRKSKICPFRNSACTKKSKRDPLGVCSLADGDRLTITCPVRFQQDKKIFSDCAELAFGKSSDFAILPEFKLLEVFRPGQKPKKIGKIDFLVGKVVDNQVIDFCALEVQSVYTSSGGVEGSFKGFLRNNNTLSPDRRTGC